MSYIVAIDPGEVHCGVAVSHDTGKVKKPKSASWVDTYTPDQLFDFLVDNLRQAQKGANPVELVIFEGYRLYPWLLEQQAWSPVPTAEVIGTIKWLCKANDTPIKEQLPPIKKPIATVAPQLGWTWKEGGTQHSLDAEYHLAYHQLRVDHAGR